MVARYWPADEAQEIGERLIARHYPDLETTRIEYVFSDERKKSKGKTVWGDCRKISGVDAFLARATQDGLFVICLYHHIWQELTFEQKVYLVDHKLSHCAVEITKNGDIALKVRGHDFEEFEAIIRRHGMKVKTDIQSIYEAMSRSTQTVFEFEDRTENGSFAETKMSVVHAGTGGFMADVIANVPYGDVVAPAGERGNGAESK